METLFIVNVDQQSFFRYKKQQELDSGYNKILSELLTSCSSNISHWSRDDKIILAPPHLFGYLEKSYNELYL